MSSSTIFTALIDLVAAADRTIDVRRITLDTTPMTAHGLTSLTMLQVFAGLEERFGVRISDLDALEAPHPIAIVALVEQKLSTVKGSAP